MQNLYDRPGRAELTQLDARAGGHSSSRSIRLGTLAATLGGLLFGYPIDTPLRVTQNQSGSAAR